MNVSEQIRRPSRRRLGAIALAGALALAVATVARGESHEGEASAEAERTPARWVEIANRALLPADSMAARATIETRDGFGGDSTCTIEMLRRSEDDAVRTLIEVESPPEGEGTVYEIVARRGEPLERWVWLPAVRRLRRISGVQRTDHFLGTEFSYEDLGLALASERGDGSVRRVQAGGDGGTIELESPSYHYYSRVVTRLDPKTGLPTRVVFYDRAGDPFREQRFEQVRRIDGQPFPTRIVVEDRLTGARSVLTFDSVRFGVEVPLERFTASEIRRRLETAEDPIPPIPTPNG
jgi:hypothetical protein